MSPEVPLIILLLSIPTYFLCKWVMNKLNIGKEQNRRLLALIPTVVLSPLIYLTLIMIWIMSISYYPSYEFDSAKWSANVEERYQMSEDIIESMMLIGKTQNDVIELLGTEFHEDNDSRMIFELGFVPGLISIDPDYLEITLENRIVVDVRQYEG